MQRYYQARNWLAFYFFSFSDGAIETSGHVLYRPSVRKYTSYVLGLERREQDRGVRFLREQKKGKKGTFTETTALLSDCRVLQDVGGVQNSGRFVRFCRVINSSYPSFIPFFGSVVSCLIIFRGVLSLPVSLEASLLRSDKKNDKVHYSHQTRNSRRVSLFLWETPSVRLLFLGLSAK